MRLFIIEFQLCTVQNPSTVHNSYHQCSQSLFALPLLPMPIADIFLLFFLSLSFSLFPLHPLFLPLLPPCSLIDWNTVIFYKVTIKKFFELCISFAWELVYIPMTENSNFKENVQVWSPHHFHAERIKK